MSAENLEPIELDDSDVDYEEYTGVLEGGVVSRSERIFDTYTDLETEYDERFESEQEDEPNRFIRNKEDTEEFRENLDATYEAELYSTLSKAGEEDIGSYADFQEAMRALAEFNYVRVLESLEESRHVITSTRNHSSNGVALLNKAGEILTEKGYTHKTKEPVKKRFDKAKSEVTEAAQLRRDASVHIKRCYFYYYTAELLIEKYNLDTKEFRYVDVEQPITKRLERVREEFMRQDRQIRRGRRSLQDKVDYVKRNSNLDQR